MLLALAVCSHVTLSYEKNGVRMLFMLVPAWAALALVYCLYQPECFLAVTAGGFGAVGLWFVRFGGVTVDVALCLVGAVLVALSGEPVGVERLCLGLEVDRATMDAVAQLQQQLNSVASFLGNVGSIFG